MWQARLKPSTGELSESKGALRRQELAGEELAAWWLSSTLHMEAHRRVIVCCRSVDQKQGRPEGLTMEQGARRCSVLREELIEGGICEGNLKPVWFH